MKNVKTPLTVATIGILALSSCTTTYDAAGRPVQSVSPGGAAVGAIAAGIAGYAIADNNNNNRNYNTRRNYNNRRNNFRNRNNNNGRFGNNFFRR